MSQNVLEVKNLCKYFEVGKGLTLKAVDDVSFEIAPGETLGLVGESGCDREYLLRSRLRRSLAPVLRGNQ